MNVKQIIVRKVTNQLKTRCRAPLTKITIDFTDECKL